MFFPNVSKTSPNYLGKTFKWVLFECCFVFEIHKDEGLILKTTIENITKAYIFWKI